jgi:hypothetical protein
VASAEPGVKRQAMKIGHLNIPKPEMDRLAFVHDIQIKLYLQYSRLIENDGPGVEILKEFEKDPRVQALDGCMISDGNGASRLETKILAMWFLWAVNEYGKEIAERNLNRFLDSETVPVINTLWVLGIEVDKAIELENGIRIVSAKEMPDSRDKEQYLRHEFEAPKMAKPKAAITYTCDITKVSRDLLESQKKDKQFWDSSRTMNDVALLLNAIEGVSCIPYFSTSYTLPEMPLGIFGGSGGGFSLHDIFGYRSSKLATSSVSEINALLHAFDVLSSDNKTRMRRVLSRLSQAKRREQIEDKILDLGIALEMMLLEDNKKNDQLSLSFRLRGSWLVGADHQDRVFVYRELRDIYDYRSQVAHTGALCGNDAKKIKLVREKFHNYAILAEKIIRELIYRNGPDWQKLILGVAERTKRG